MEGLRARSHSALSSSRAFTSRSCRGRPGPPSCLEPPLGLDLGLPSLAELGGGHAHLLPEHRRKLLGGRETQLQGQRSQLDVRLDEQLLGALDARRPVGSLLKPAVYLAALQRPESYAVNTLIADEPITVDMHGKPNAKLVPVSNFDGLFDEGAGSACTPGGNSRRQTGALCAIAGIAHASRRSHRKPMAAITA